MQPDEVRGLPAVRTLTVGESEHRRLSQRAAEADRLAARVAELEERLAAAAARSGGDPVEELLRALLPTLDDFERGLAAAGAGQDYAAIVAGLELVHRELGRVLAWHGFERVPVTPGSPYDPDLHQSIDHDGHPGEGAVTAEELRSGWSRGSRVLRRALVRVSWLKAGAGPQ